MKCGNQSIGIILYIRLGSPGSEFIGSKWFDAYRYMCGDDHKLTFSLALFKFTYKPVITGLIERAISIADGRIVIYFTLCIVEHNDLYGYIRFRIETIRGKVIVDIGLGKTVTHRI